MLNNRYCCLLWLSLVAGTVSAEVDFAEVDLEDLYADEDIVNIATGTAKQIRYAPAVASVVTAADIKRQGARDLDEVLELVPGIHVSRSFNRFNSLYSIRGIHTGENPQVLMLIDGMQVSDITNGSRMPNFRMPVENIKRIEVIRGPGSAVYGADAFAGVINIVTKDAGDLGGLRTGARAGSFGTQDGWLQYGGALGEVALAGSLEYTKSDGDDNRRAARDLQTTFDEAMGTSLSLAPGPFSTNYEDYNASVKAQYEGVEWSAFTWQANHVGIGPGGAQALDSDGYQDVEYYATQIKYSSDIINAFWQFDATLSYNHLYLNSYFKLFPNGAVLPIGSDGNIGIPGVGLVTFTEGYIGNPIGSQDTTTAESAIYFTGLTDHRWRIAIGRKYIWYDTSEKKNFGPGVLDGGESSVNGKLTDVSDTEFVFFEDKDRDNHYLSVQDEWQFAPDWELTAGLRYDSYSDFGETVNPRISLVWATNHALTTKLLYGKAFRAPSFGELYFKNNPSLTGNANLTPERIQTLELAFDYRPTLEFTQRGNIFSYRVDDLIQYVATDAGNIAQNAGKTHGYGFELETEYKLSEALRLVGNYSWQRANDDITDDVVADAPGQQLSLLADYEVNENWSAGMQFNAVMDRERLATDVRDPIEDATTLDLTVRRRLALPGAELALRVKNLADAALYEPSDGKISNDYRLEGRMVLLEARYDRL